MLRRLTSFIYRHYIRSTHQLKSQASNAWAVGTGGSDGIGFAMCKYLANKGYNICIVARNQGKIDQKLMEIQGVKTMSIIADFSKMETIQEYQT